MAVEPDAPSPQPPDPSRRKLLLVGGFGAATALLVGKLATKNRSVLQTADDASAPVRVEVTGDHTPLGAPVMDGAEAMPPAGFVYDRVIKGGRVIDPETGYDAVADVGLVGDRIRAISEQPLTGKATTDAAGLVVAPGFIDLLSYEPNPYGVWYKLGDGVTTNLGMHGINNTAAAFFATYAPESQRPPIHYGGAFDDPWMRDYAKLGNRSATDAQMKALDQALEEGIGNGWLGVDVEPEYTPWVTNEEITGLARVGAAHGLPMFSHIRYSEPGTPEAGSLQAIDELLHVAEDTGVAVHVDHITSMATHVMPEAVAKIDAARNSGIDVTACLYPYTFWATYLGSQRFAPGWQDRFRISYNDLEIAGTGERLTESSFRRYQAQNKLVAAYAIPDADVVTALKTPWTLIGSDAILEPSNNNHPRAAGCFTRVLGHYVREQGVLTLMDALSKMTIQPAKRVEGRSPQMRRKGRLQVGADADITVFDPAKVGDTSTVENPAQMAAGVEYVIVMGQPVKERDVLHKDARPGQPIKSETA